MRGRRFMYIKLVGKNVKSSNLAFENGLNMIFTIQ